MGELTNKQERFCYEYMKDMNATQAAIRAGYSENSADKVGSQLLGKDRIAAKVEKLKNEIKQESKATVEKTVKELGRIAYSNIKDMVDVKRGNLYIKDLDSLPREITAAIKKISQTQHGLRIQLYDKIKALELIGKHLAMFTEKHEITGKDGAPLTQIAKEAQEWKEENNS